MCSSDLIQLATSVVWKGISIAVPVYLTLEQPQFNPTFNETTWLTTQKIVPIKFTFTARTYLILPEKQLLETGAASTDNTPPFNVYDGNTNEDIILSASVLLEFASRKNFGDLDYSDKDLGPYTSDVVAGYLDPAEFNITYTATEITTSSFKLNWVIPVEDKEAFAYLNILIPGRPNVLIEDVLTVSRVITGLQPASIYEITVLTYDTSGNVKTNRLSVTTLSGDSSDVGNSITTKKGKLKGMEW